MERSIRVAALSDRLEMVSAVRMENGSRPSFCKEWLAGYQQSSHYRNKRFALIQTLGA